jgi:protein-S-isoprenylcysteine O-methyltransferase Ste14
VHVLPLIALHGAFYALCLIRLAGRGSGASAPLPPATPLPGGGAAPHAVSLLVLHAAAFILLYLGLAHALLDRRGALLLLAPHPAAGAVLIVAGMALLAWALAAFRSYRMVARIEPGHQLCTTGPFRLVRHPIYVSFDLLALGTFLWVPHPVVLAGAVAAIVVADRRARGEERLLREVFGEPYRLYCRRVARTIPGLY